MKQPCMCMHSWLWMQHRWEETRFIWGSKKAKFSEGIMRNCSLTAPYLFELMILYMPVMQALTSLHFRFPLEHNCMRIQLYLPELRPASYINIAQKMHNNKLQFSHIAKGRGESLKLLTRTRCCSGTVPLYTSRLWTTVIAIARSLTKYHLIRRASCLQVATRRCTCKSKITRED